MTQWLLADRELPLEGIMVAFAGGGGEKAFSYM